MAKRKISIHWLKILKRLDRKLVAKGFSPFLSPNEDLSRLGEEQITFLELTAIASLKDPDKISDIAAVSYEELAEPYDMFQEYARQIRKEYSHVTDSDFARGRIDFMNKMLAQKKIFHLDWPEEEKTAGENMEKSIQYWKTFIK